MCVTVLFGVQQLSKLNIQEIDICGDITKHSSIRYFGAFLGGNLTFKDNIKIKCITVMLNFCFRIKHSQILQDASETLVVFLVVSQLKYCNAILYGIPDCDIAKLQHTQNMYSKLILNCKKRDSHSTICTGCK